MAFGRIWAHGKYSYGACRWFAYNSGNFQKWPKIEKCQHFFQRLDFDPNNTFLFHQPNRRPGMSQGKVMRTGAIPKVIHSIRYCFEINTNRPFWRPPGRLIGGVWEGGCTPRNYMQVFVCPLSWAELWLVNKIFYTVWVKTQLREKMLTLLDFGSFTQIPELEANHWHTPYEYFPCCQILPNAIYGNNQENIKFHWSN